MSCTYGAGVDMGKFVKPGDQKPYREMTSTATQGALADVGIAPGASS